MVNASNLIYKCIPNVKLCTSARPQQSLLLRRKRRHLEWRIRTLWNTMADSCDMVLRDTCPITGILRLALFLGQKPLVQYCISTCQLYLGDISTSVLEISWLHATTPTGSFPGVRRPWRVVDHTPPSSAKVKNGRDIPSLPHMYSLHSA
jgi:hypothetical protein